MYSRECNCGLCTDCLKWETRFGQFVDPTYYGRLRPRWPSTLARAAVPEHPRVTARESRPMVKAFVARPAVWFDHHRLRRVACRYCGAEFETTIKNAFCCGQQDCRKRRDADAKRRRRQRNCGRR